VKCLGKVDPAIQTLMCTLHYHFLLLYSDPNSNYLTQADIDTSVVILTFVQTVSFAVQV
jgi:hypothetical protein